MNETKKKKSLCDLASGRGNRIGPACVLDPIIRSSRSSFYGSIPVTKIANERQRVVGAFMLRHFY